MRFSLGQSNIFVCHKWRSTTLFVVQFNTLFRTSAIAALIGITKVLVSGKDPRPNYAGIYNSDWCPKSTMTITIIKVHICGLNPLWDYGGRRNFRQRLARRWLVFNLIHWLLSIYSEIDIVEEWFLQEHPDRRGGAADLDPAHQEYLCWSLLGVRLNFSRFIGSSNGSGWSWPRIGFDCQEKNRTTDPSAKKKPNPDPTVKKTWSWSNPWKGFFLIFTFIFDKI